ncbi:unnamed protein product [Rotaria magnacalcarata]
MSNQLYEHNNQEIVTVENIGVIIGRQKTTVELGEIRDTTEVTFIRNTYPAQYNHVVTNMNTINYQTNTENKRIMRGGHFFLYRYVIIFALILCFVFGIASIYAKPCAVVPFLLTVLYLALSIFNIVVFIRNRPVINPILTQKVNRGLLDGMINRFFVVPINATVLTGILAVFINPGAILDAVRRENVQLTEIKVMLYDDRYQSRSYFPKEIIIHIFVFFIMFILAIVFVGTTVSK